MIYYTMQHGQHKRNKMNKRKAVLVLLTLGASSSCLAGPPVVHRWFEIFTHPEIVTWIEKLLHILFRL